jgi:hypothetical protein
VGVAKDDTPTSARRHHQADSGLRDGSAYEHGHPFVWMALRFFLVAEAFIVRCGVVRRIFFLECRVRIRERLPDVLILAVLCTFDATLFGSVERFSAISCVTFVSVPAARPSLRATVFNRGSCLAGCFFAAILRPCKRFSNCTSSAMLNKKEVPA